MTLHSIIDQFDLLMDAPDSVSKLRQFILQLAVQGKLTEQDPSDESADHLLERVRKRKKQWLEENDSPRRRSLGDFPDETPFELPSSWGWTRLDDVSIYIQRGKSPDYAEVEEIPVVSQKCIQWEGFQSNRVRFIDPDSLDGYQDYRFLRSGDLLWNSTGVGTVGRVNVYRGELSEYRRVVADSHVTIVRIVNDLVLPDYVFCWIASAYIQGRIDSEMTSGSTKQTELNTTTVRETLLPLPPLEEQQRIVATVERLMGECDTLDAQQDAAEQVRIRCTEAATHALQTADTPAAARTAWHRLRDHFDALCATSDDVDAVRQTILQLAVQGKLTEQDPRDESAEALLKRIKAEKERLYEAGEIRKPKKIVPPEESDSLFELPEGWVWSRFSDIATIVSDRVDPTDFPWMPHISPANIEQGNGKLLPYNTIEEDGVTSSKNRFQPGHIVYSKIRPNLKKAIIAEFEGLCSADMYPVRSHTNTAYLLQYILSEPFTHQVTDGDNRVAMPKTNQSELRRVVVPLPPLDEQQRIVATIDRLIDVCDTLETQLNRQQTLGAELLDAVLHGAAHGEDALQPA
jgi:type I restriction enzyme S subunit